ncbi:conserved Plasmodium protein, unknown function [Plasmodium berghei]|uniref:Microtubule-associated protein Jupiter n=2 Tax=Plasmodium berghei TaxID=5821 RepID=A0A509AJU5_PLABA|nr:conserved Plasmodium protein, unknown function [Plasmodium berghei ANKA]CXH91951.1 conserved Plasmodium protein, unknown function [Plasmodium berghei]VUC54052.1 conserved Plasmodium protein, unknown function [Plasmodium berghei ANKA]|eukprot:XP_034419897.1 conserved Plasmodium protein, unknown function [Plasmodium berghei ANKA]
MDVSDNPFIKNRSSTRVTNAPGGNSSLSFGNYISEENERLRVRKGNTESQMNTSTEAAGNSDIKKTTNQSDRKTNVKVNQPPGGASSIIFG